MIDSEDCNCSPFLLYKTLYQMQIAQTPERHTMVEIMVTYKNPTSICDRITVSSSRHLQQLFREIWETDTIEICEQVYVLYLNNSLHVLGFVKLTTGTIDGCTVDVRRLFAIALKVNATHLAIAHNHPSGNLKPGKADHEVTQRINSCAKFHNIKFLDHIILTCESYFSFADSAMID